MSRPIIWIRHRTFDAYVNAKARIFENQRGDDFTVLNADDPTCVSMAARTHKAQVFWFSRQKRGRAGGVGPGRRSSLFRDSRRGQREILQVSDIPSERRAQSRKRPRRRVCGRFDGLRTRENSAGSREFQSGRASPRIRGNHPRGGLLQRFEGHERRCHHQGA